MSFTKLLSDLEAFSSTSAIAAADLGKSMAADGDDDGAGADDGAGEGGEGGGDADDAAIVDAAADGEAAGDAADGDDGDADLGKSFQFQTEDGRTVEALDATDLLKSLMDRVETNEGQTVKLLGGLMDLVKSQAADLGALRTEVSRLGSAGRGRRTVVTVAEKPAGADLNKSMAEEPEGITANEFMAKAMEACSAGRLTGLDVARCESYLNRGLDVPANIKSKVLGA